MYRTIAICFLAFFFTVAARQGEAQTVAPQLAADGAASQNSAPQVLAPDLLAPQDSAPIDSAVAVLPQQGLEMQSSAVANPAAVSTSGLATTDTLAPASQCRSVAKASVGRSQRDIHSEDCAKLKRRYGLSTEQANEISRALKDKQKSLLRKQQSGR